MSQEELNELTPTYRDALVRLDALSLILGNTLVNIQAKWFDGTTCDIALAPLNQIAKQIEEAIPDDIKRTRPPMIEVFADKIRGYWVEK